MDELIIFSIIIALLGYWWNSANAYEVAISAAKSKCLQLGLKLLDDTLQISSIKICRHEAGYVQFCRSYGFEFISDGDVRYQGKVFLSGRQLEKIEMEAYRLNQDDTLTDS